MAPVAPCARPLPMRRPAAGGACRTSTSHSSPPKDFAAAAASPHDARTRKAPCPVLGYPTTARRDKCPWSCVVPRRVEAEQQPAATVGCAARGRDEGLRE
ncbi:hypothetical protein PVAP13_2KG203075 [Panicum virgatum]|uniref:Uncharacterized protein n=1 Tax=Panicum virgatum TaxID=38727 RepID=A0A8T0WAH1_PANVG|nr:hypothetical protein PVAP13_2KG203075 [Panicum virgatum]